MSGLLEGKRLLITGVINHASIAFAVAKLAQEQGAQIVLTGHGRVHMVEYTARRLPHPPPVNLEQPIHHWRSDITNDGRRAWRPRRPRPCRASRACACSP